MPIGTKVATKSVKHKVKNDAKDSVGLDNDKKHKNEHGTKGKIIDKKGGRGIL